MTIPCFIMRDRKPVPANNILEAALFAAEPNNVTVATTSVGPSIVSTIFLCFPPHSPPKPPEEFFETAIFGGRRSGYCIRAATYTEAEANHAATCALARYSLDS